MSVIKLEKVPGSNLFPTANGSAFVQSSYDPYDLSSDDEEYLMPKSIIETTAG